jgi:ethanolamine transporter
MNGIALLKERNGAMNMGINDIVILIVVAFFGIGALDRIFGNKFGLGDRFTEGFMAMGTLTLSMVGIISLAPVIANIFTPVITPLYNFIGADPASFANTLLAIDMGGYALASEMSLSEDAEVFSWVFLGTMLGPTIVFSIPVALGIIPKESQSFFAQGILIGLVTIPLGCFVGGLIGGLDIGMILKNLLIPFLLSLFICIGLWKKMNVMIKAFSIFGKFIEIIAIVGLVAITIETMSGYVLIPNLAPLNEGIQIVGTIAIFLAGAFPLVKCIQLFLKHPMKKLGNILGINEMATVGLITTLAHNIPMFTILKDMDNRGKVINVAFSVSAAFVFGSHLGFVASQQPNMVFAMIAGKLIGGIAAILLALVLVSYWYKRDER